MRIFAERFKELIENKNIKITKMATDVGISHTNLYDYLNDKIEPLASNVVKIAKYFGVTTDYLLGMEDEFGNKI